MEQFRSVEQVASVQALDPVGRPSLATGRRSIRSLRDAEALRAISYERAVQSADPGLRLIAHTLAALHAAVPTTRLEFGPVDDRGDANGPAVVMTNGSVPVPAERNRRDYLLRHQLSDPTHPRLFVGDTLAVVGPDDLGGAEALDASEFGRHYLAPQGLRSIARLFLRRNQRMFASVLLVRAARERDFERRELDFLRRVAPFIEHAHAYATPRQRPGPRGELGSGRLTARERHVAELAATGLRSRELAVALGLSEATVKTHLAHIFAKLGLRTRAELAARLNGRSEDQSFG